MNKIPMTPEGHKKLQERLKYLKSVERPKIVQAIEVARGHGDLSENAEYEAAKDAQGHCNSEMKMIEDKLARAQVIDPATITHTKIAFGATVSIEDTQTDTKVTYQIVGEDESDIKLGRISIMSPIAKALIGKEEGDIVTVQTPKGTREFEILAIEYK